MSVLGKKGTTIPYVLLHEGEGLYVTVETRNGTIYYGYMEEGEDNWNCHLKDAVVTCPKGSITKLNRVFIRGGEVVFIILPDMLGVAPMFKRVELRKQGVVQARGLGMGRSQAMMAKAIQGNTVPGGRGGPPMRSMGGGRGGPGGPPGPGAPPRGYGGPPPQGFGMPYGGRR